MNWLAIVLVTIGIVLNNRHIQHFWMCLLLAEIAWIIYSIRNNDYAMIVFCSIVAADNIYDNYIRIRKEKAEFMQDR